MEPLSRTSPLALRGEQKPIGSTLTSPTACRVRRRVLWRVSVVLCVRVCGVWCVCVCCVCARGHCEMYVYRETVNCERDARAREVSGRGSVRGRGAFVGGGSFQTSEAFKTQNTRLASAPPSRRPL